LTNSTKTACKRLEAKYFNEWKAADTQEAREAIHSKLQALSDLQFAMINTIRGTEDG